MNINNQDKNNFKDIKEYYKNNINPQLHTAFKILGLDDLDYISSKGMFIHLENGEKIYDFTSGLGVLNLGHNHPRINEVEIKCIQNDTVDFLKIGVNKQQALLANYLTSLLPEKLNKAFFSVIPDPQNIELEECQSKDPLLRELISIGKPPRKKAKSAT